MNNIRNSYIISSSGNHALLNKETLHITEEEKNFVSFMNNNKIYNKIMKGNEVFNNLLEGNDKKVAELMGITNDQLAAVKTITNLKAKLGKESLSCNMKDTSLKNIEYWSDFTHQIHHEEELAIVLNKTPKKRKKNGMSTQMC